MGEMEKKSLGRGFEEVSKVFLSNNKDKRGRRDFSSTSRRGSICTSCLNYLEEVLAPPKCTVFAFGNSENSFPPPDPVIMNNANYCQHFRASSLRKPHTTEQKDGRQPLPGENAFGEIEETVSVQRRIAYPDLDGVQQEVRKVLLDYLGVGFEIRTIELSKTEEKIGPRKTFRRENVIICVKNPSPL